MGTDHVRARIEKRLCLGHVSTLRLCARHRLCQEIHVGDILKPFTPRLETLRGNHPLVLAAPENSVVVAVARIKSVIAAAASESPHRRAVQAAHVAAPQIEAVVVQDIFRLHVSRAHVAPYLAALGAQTARNLFSALLVAEHAVDDRPHLVELRQFRFFDIVHRRSARRRSGEIYRLEPEVRAEFLRHGGALGGVRRDVLFHELVADERLEDVVARLESHPVQTSSHQTEPFRRTVGRSPAEHETHAQILRRAEA